MFCTTCGKMITAGDKFCGSCGKELILNNNINASQQVNVESKTDTKKETSKTQVYFGKKIVSLGIALFSGVVSMLIVKYGFLLLASNSTSDKNTVSSIEDASILGSLLVLLAVTSYVYKRTVTKGFRDTMVSSIIASILGFLLILAAIFFAGG